MWLGYVRFDFVWLVMVGLIWCGVVLFGSFGVVRLF